LKHLLLLFAQRCARFPSAARIQWNETEYEMEPITMYCTTWCPDCWRAKSFLKKRGVEFREVDIEEDSSGEAIVIKANNGKRKVPTLEVGGRYFACSPFDAEQLAEELNIPLNP
jgi:mycoredoxin